VRTAFSSGLVASDTIVYHLGPDSFAVIAGIYRAAAQRHLLLQVQILMTTKPLKNTLKVHRAMPNWTQEELARHLDVARKTINTVENGRYVPPVLLPSRSRGRSASPSKRCSD